MRLEDSTREMEQAFLKDAADLAEEFRVLADDLDKHFKNIRIARITGSSTSAVAGGVAIVAAALAPVTLGISLIPAAVASGVSVVGGIVSGGSELTGSIIKRLKMNEMEEKWKSFKDRCQRDFPRRYQKLILLLKHLVSVMGTLGKGIRSTIESGKTAAATVKAVSGTSKSATAAEAAVVAGGVVKGVSKATVVLGVIGVAFSVADIVTASIDLHKKKKCPAGDQLRELARVLDELAQE